MTRTQWIVVQVRRIRVVAEGIGRQQIELEDLLLIRLSNDGPEHAGVRAAVQCEVGFRAPAEHQGIAPGEKFFALVVPVVPKPLVCDHVVGVAQPEL